MMGDPGHKASQDSLMEVKAFLHNPGNEDGETHSVIQNTYGPQWYQQNNTYGEK